MADELQPGTANAAEPVAPVTAPEPTQTPQETKPPASPPVGTGDEVATLRAELAERERVIAEVNERAARAEHEALLTRNLVENFARTQGKPQEPEHPKLTLNDDEYLTNPAMATTKIVDDRVERLFSRLKDERDKEKAEQYINSARSAVDQGKLDAIKANPSLYRGLENQIYNDMATSISQSLKAGVPPDVTTYRDTKTWEAMAVARRLANGEDMQSIVSKYYAKPHTPMSPAHTEVPGPGNVPKAEMVLSPEQEELISKGHVTREQFMKSWAFERRKAEERTR